MLLRLLATMVVAIASGTAFAAESTTKSDSTPDFCQTDAEGRFHNGGREFCGPVAISNSIMWLAQNGYARLIDGKEVGKSTQIELIRTLGSSDYMGTDRADGTGPQRLIEGVAKYVRGRGQRLARMEFRGWRDVDTKYKSTKSLPTTEWVHEAIANPRSGACANIGWYTRDNATDTFMRRGGHWMTVTGASASNDEATIDLHDPAARSGQGNVTHHAHLDRLTSGTLAGERADLPTKAAGLFVIRDGIVPKQVAKGEKTYPIIDGIVVFVLQ